MSATSPLKAFLIAEDEVAMLLRADLDADDLPVRFGWDGAGDLQAALRRLPESDADVVIAQLDLPDSQGVATLHAVRGAAGHRPVIVLGRLDDVDGAVEAIREGAQDVLLSEDDEVMGMARRIRFAMERERLRRGLAPEGEKVGVAVAKRG